MARKAAGRAIGHASGPASELNRGIKAAKFVGVKSRVFWLANLLKDLSRDVNDDNLWNGAAAVSYYFLLSVVPLTVFLVTLLPFLPIPHLEQVLFDFLSTALPSQSEKFLLEVVRGILSTQHQGLLSFGILLAVWTSSSGTYALIREINVVYNAHERRPWWKLRGIAVGLTLAFLVLMIGAMGLILLGNRIQNFFFHPYEVHRMVLFLFGAVRWGVIVVLLLFNLNLVYFFGPDVRQRFQFLNPGAVLGTVILIVSSVVFQYYVSKVARYGTGYGSLAALVVLMVWFFIVSFVILLGAEFNSHLNPFTFNGKPSRVRRKNHWRLRHFQRI